MRTIFWSLCLAVLSSSVAKSFASIADTSFQGEKPSFYVSKSDSGDRTEVSLKVSFGGAESYTVPFRSSNFILADIGYCTSQFSDVKLAPALEWSINFGSQTFGMADTNDRLNSIMSYGRVSAFYGQTKSDLYSKNQSVPPNPDLPALVEITSFGLKGTGGYGWRFGSERTPSSQLSLLHGSSLLTWGLIGTPVGTDDSTQRTRILSSPFYSSTRYANSYSLGARFDMTEAMGIEISNETTLFFPSYRFFPWLGSTLVESFGQTIVTSFITGNALKNSPKSAPFISFLLHGAISTLMYELRSSSANWPFGGGEPLIVRSFKFSFSIGL